MIMSTRSEIRRRNLNRLIDEAGSATALAKRAGTDEAYLSQLVTGVKTKQGTVRGVGDKLAAKLEKAMNKADGWLDRDHATVSTGLDAILIKKEQELIPVVLRQIPLLSWVQAGSWSEVIPGVEETIPVAGNFGRNVFALRVRGDSMEPKFPDGCTIIVEPDLAADTNSFVVVQINSGSEAMFKQLVRDGARVFLKALNPAYGVLLVDKPMTICGVVRKAIIDV